MKSNDLCPLCNAVAPGNNRDAFARALVNAPTVCDERFFHDDIADMPVEALRRERYHIRLGLSLSSKRQQWGMDRLARIEQELRVRCAH